MSQVSNSVRHAPQVPTARPLEGRTALVTGAGRGLGAAISQRLAGAGAQLVMVGRDRDSLESLAATLPGDHVVAPADLSHADAAHATIATAIEQTGRIDVLINNAGMAYNAPANEISAEDFDTVIALNLRAPFLLAGAAAKAMADSGTGGAIINISTALAGAGVAGTSLYVATKGALEAVTRSLAAEWGHAGVRVNAIRPAVTRSDMSAPLLGDQAFRERYLPVVPLGDIGEAEDIAATVQFLVSDEGAYITGQVLDVDGGWGMWRPTLHG